MVKFVSMSVVATTVTVRQKRPCSVVNVVKYFAGDKYNDNFDDAKSVSLIF